MPKRANSRMWTDEDTERLRLHIARGGSAPRASVIFKRSQAAVRTRASELGLKFPTIRDLRRKAAGTPCETVAPGIKPQDISAKTQTPPT
jgi:hypothetical protein